MVLGLALACSAPAQNQDMAGAERAERDGNHDQALALYQQAQRACNGEERTRRRRATCASAYLHHAELLDRMGHTRAAARAYEQVPVALPDDDAASAAGLYRAGGLYLRLGEDERAYSLLWKTITHYPNQGYAADALKDVLRDGRRRNPAQLYQVLADLVQPLAGTRIADNVLYAMADLAEHDRGDPRAALGLYDKITIDYPGSGLRDDAWWHGARLARALGNPRGAAKRLRALLATREVARGTGSYLSVWHDDAQLALGRVLRDDLDDPHAALAAFARLPAHYPASLLRDDALWDTALTWDRLDSGPDACATLARLARAFPDSRYELSLAPEMRRKHGCQDAPAPE